MKASFYFGMVLGTVGTVLLFKKDDVSKMMAKAKKR